MLNFSQLDFFADAEMGDQGTPLDRRSLLKACFPATLLTLGLFNRSGSKEQELEIPDDPPSSVRSVFLPSVQW